MCPTLPLFCDSTNECQLMAHAVKLSSRPDNQPCQVGQLALQQGLWLQLRQLTCGRMPSSSRQHALPGQPASQQPLPPTFNSAHGPRAQQVLQSP